MPTTRCLPSIARYSFDDRFIVSWLNESGSNERAHLARGCMVCCPVGCEVSKYRGFSARTSPVRNRLVSLHCSCINDDTFTTLQHNPRQQESLTDASDRTSHASRGLCRFSTSFELGGVLVWQKAGLQTMGTAGWNRSLPAAQYTIGKRVDCLAKRRSWTPCEARPGKRHVCACGKKLTRLTRGEVPWTCDCASCMCPAELLHSRPVSTVSQYM